MTLVKKFKVGDRVEITSGDSKGRTGKIDQINFMKHGLKSYWWYCVVFDKPKAGSNKAYMFRDSAIKKI